MQTNEWEALLAGTTPGPWEVETVLEMRYYDGETWEVPGEIVVSAGEATLFVAADGFVGDEGGEHDNEKNVRLAAAAPELATELYRIITDLEGLLDVVKHETWLYDDEGQFPETVQLGNYVVDQLTRILEGDTDE